MRFRNGKYQCAVCGQTIDLPSFKRPQIVVMGSSGKRSVRVVRVEGREIHRCETGRDPFFPRQMGF